VLDVTFYGDESGIHDPHGNQPGSEVAAIAGYIATKRQWSTFERRWNTALRKFRVSKFRMSEFYRADPPYDKWSAAKKRRFLLTLIRIACDNTIAGYASMVRTKEWDTILDDETKLGFPQNNPWHTCFQNFFAKFLHFLKEMVDPVISKRIPPEKIVFVFHQHKVFGPAAEIGYTIILKALDHGGRLGTISFGSSEDYLPLQAADLFAFYCRRRFTRFLKNVPEDEFELALLNPDKVYLLELSPDNLKDLREKNEQARYARDLASGKTTTGTPR